MPYIGAVIHHKHKRKRKYSKKLEPFPSKKKIIRFIDKAIYFVGIFAVLMTLPQVLKIWVEQNPVGVSMVTWTTYLVSTSFWIAYGILHKEKPIMVIYGLGFILNFLIVLGLILYS